MYLAPWPWWPSSAAGHTLVYFLSLFSGDSLRLRFLRSPFAMSSFSKPIINKPTLAVSTDPWELLTPSPSGSIPSSGGSSAPSLQAVSSSLSSGEFNAFSFVGAAVAAGEGSGGRGNEKSLFLLPTERGICLGNISGSKFCTKMCVDGRSCGIPTHASRKFRASSDHVYILEAETKAFCEPRLEITVLDDKQLALLLSQHFTKEKWTSIIVSMEQGSYPEWLLSVQSTPVKEDSNKPEPITSTMGVLGLRSPQQAVLKNGTFRHLSSVIV